MGIKRVLIIEDETDLLDLMAEIIAGPEIEVIPTECAYKGLQLIENNNIDLIISDWIMPGFDGNSFLYSIAKIKSPRPPVLFVTSAWDVDEVQDTSQKEQVTILPKPFHLEELRRDVYHLLHLTPEVSA